MARYYIPKPKIKRAVLFPNPFKETMASARIAQWVADELQVELWDSPEKIKYEEIDELYFIYGLVAFSKFREEMGALHPYVKKYVYIENDFLGCHLTQLRKPLAERGIVPIMLTTCPHRLERGRGYYINWNQMTWDPVPDWTIKPNSERVQGLAYYGSFRKDRVDYFKRYFDTDLYPVHTFSGRTGQREFAAINPNVVTHEQAQNLNETLNDYGCTIYIEDKFSHRRYSSVANRFFECLAAGIPMLFDETTVGTMVRGGFDVTPYVVNSAEGVAERFRHLQEIGEMQRDSWRGVNYRDTLKTQFHNLLPLIAACDPCTHALP